MADKLTPQQAQAVHDRGGMLLVSAAAGSGKTKVLVDRLLEYLTDPHDPANLDEFLIITYTKAAASELRGKIAAKLTERIALEPENRHLQKQMQRLFLTKISTVHGFCGDLLREYAYRLDIPAWPMKTSVGRFGKRCCRICWTGFTKRKPTAISGPSWIRRVWDGMTVWCLTSWKRSMTAPAATLTHKAGWKTA